MKAYVRLWERWIRDGKPGRPPSAVEHGVKLADLNNELSEMEGRIREETGLSSWWYYAPDYHDPMLEVRRNAVAAGVDPDAAAMEFHRKYMAKKLRSTKKKMV